jgi:DNA (cytosine-5)-methyltransferase 1
VTTVIGGTYLGETFHQLDDRLVKELRIGEITYTSSIDNPDPTGDAKGDWWRGYLRGTLIEAERRPSPPVSVVDLFSGPGGLALGLVQACRELGHRVVSEVAVDQDEEAVPVYVSNHGTRRASTSSVLELVDFQVRGLGRRASFHHPPEVLVPGWDDLVGSTDVILAGPPCQGHSNLNNRSRRNDHRNVLYWTVPAIAVALRAKVVIIENVPAVVHDRLQVVATTAQLLENEGYIVKLATFSASSLGWPQSRRRFFLIATSPEVPAPLDPLSIGAMLEEPSPRDLRWVIGDLEDAPVDGGRVLEVELSDENRRRIDYLFDHDVYDLPLDQRPECHQEGTTYNAVYGRLRYDQPAPTITTGFMTPGRGRYIHPTRRRVLTPWEAARLQGFPDTYDFHPDPCRPTSKFKLSKWIGDAVPMPLGYAAALSALGNWL